VRIHGTTKRQVGQLFAEEKKHLLPLPPSLFPVFRERLAWCIGQLRGSGQGLLCRAAEYIGQQIWVRWDQREVRLFNARWEQIQIHRRLEPGQFSKVLGIGGGQGTSKPISNIGWAGRGNWAVPARSGLRPSCSSVASKRCAR